MKLWKTQLHKVGRSGGFLGRRLGSLLKTGLPFPLMEDVLRSLAKSVSIKLGVTVATSATDAAIHQKMFGSGMNTLITPKEEVSDIMKIVAKFLEESGL